MILRVLIISAAALLLAAPAPALDGGSLTRSTGASRFGANRSTSSAFMRSQGTSFASLRSGAFSTSGFSRTQTQNKYGRRHYVRFGRGFSDSHRVRGGQAKASPPKVYYGDRSSSRYTGNRPNTARIHYATATQ